MPASLYDVYNPVSIRHVIDSNEKIDASKPRPIHNESAIRKETNVKPDGDTLTKSAVNKMSGQELLNAHPYVARLVSHSHALELKRELVKQAEAARAAIHGHELQSNISVDSAINALTRLNDDAAKRISGLLRRHFDSIRGEYSEHPSPSVEERQELSKWVSDNLGNAKSRPRSYAAEKVDAAYSDLHKLLQAHDQAEQLQNDAKAMRVLAHVARNPSYAWMSKMMPGRAQKIGMQLLNNFGMLTMVMSTPLLFISFKQMYDEFKGPPQQQQQQ